MQQPIPGQPLTLRPYQWSAQQTVLKIILYPCLLGLCGAAIGLLSGNGALALILLLGFPLLALPVAAIAGSLVRANQGTMVTADESQVVKRGVLRTSSCPRQQLAAIVYGVPVRGAIECQFLRKDGATAFRVTLAPWVPLQQELKDFASALGVPLRPNRWARQFRL